MTRARSDDIVTLRLSESDDQELLQRSPLLGYLAPGRYAEVRDSQAFPFPAGFRR